MVNRKLENRISNIESKLNILWQDRQCAAGIHKWEPQGIDGYNPYVRCSHCYFNPSKEVKK